MTNAFDGLTPGGIVLMHDGYAGADDRDTGARAQPPGFDRGELTERLLDAIAAKGWTTIPVESPPRARTRPGRALWLGK